MARDCGHTGTGMTWFDVGADCLALCSRCYAAVTQPWHDKLHETSAALAEAQRELQEIRGVIGFPGAVALAEAGLTESLADVVRYTHRQWLEQTHNSNQRVIRAEAAVDAAQRERDAEKAENEDLRADLVWAVGDVGAGFNPLECFVAYCVDDEVKTIECDGTDTDLCRAIREARRGE